MTMPTNNPSRQDNGTPSLMRRWRSMRCFSLCIAGPGLVLFSLSGCGGGGTSSCGSCHIVTQPQAAAPSITTAQSPNGATGAVIVTLADTTSGATIYYTLDGTTPTTSSPIYSAPFLVAANLTVNAIAVASSDSNSEVASQAFAPNLASGTLVWSDEFTNSGASNSEPNPATWTYDTGYQCCGNNEQETYCAWGSNSSPCNSSNPNALIAPGGGLNIVAQNPSGANYTSARLKSEGLFSFMYGRIEAKILLPESQGMWPAFWMLGNNIANSEPWPACGEADIMEHIDGNNTPFGGPNTGPLPGYDWYQASIHGTGLSGGTPYPASAANGYSATAWHTYGMIWTKGQIQYYIDDPANIYETFTTSSPGTGTWPFDQGPMFVILNLAVGGDWPGDVDAGTVFPSTMQVQYVRIYTN